jgi:hypothetical protein
MVASWNPLFFLKHRFHILRFPNSTGLFTKPTGHRYTKYRFSPDIGGDELGHADFTNVGQVFNVRFRDAVEILLRNKVSWSDTGPMMGENRQLVTNEPVEFEK